MQNRYTGDIGDYGKLGLLRRLRSAGLKIGVNWYLTPNETHNGDGRHIQYLDKEAYRVCDEPLWTELRAIVQSEQRDVRELQKERILTAAFFIEELSYTGKTKTERAERRRDWHRAALTRLSGADIVFVDPDNGLMVPSAEGTPRDNKYVAPAELIDYYRQGASVIYYQHKARRPDGFYINQHKRLLAADGLENATGSCLKFTTTSQRYYFFILQPAHRELVLDTLQQMLASPWSRHFYLCWPYNLNSTTVQNDA